MFFGFDVIIPTNQNLSCTWGGSGVCSRRVIYIRNRDHCEVSENAGYCVIVDGQLEWIKKYALIGECSGSGNGGDGKFLLS